MRTTSGRSAFAVTLYALLEPLPLGFFSAAWLFDIIYMRGFEIMWTDAASWLIVFGLVIAVLPRLISLVYLFRGSAAPEKPTFGSRCWPLSLLC